MNITPVPTATAAPANPPAASAHEDGFDHALRTANHGLASADTTPPPGAHATAASTQPNPHPTAAASSTSGDPGATAALLTRLGLAPQNGPVHAAGLAKAAPDAPQDAVATLANALLLAHFAHANAATGGNAGTPGKDRPDAKHPAHKPTDATLVAGLTLIAAVPIAAPTTASANGEPHLASAKGKRAASLPAGSAAGTQVPASADKADAATGKLAAAAAAESVAPSTQHTGREALRAIQGERATTVAQANPAAQAHGHAAVASAADTVAAGAALAKVVIDGSAQASDRAPTPGGNGLFALGTIGHTGAAATPAAAQAPLALMAPIGSNPWQQELGQQLIQLTQRGEQQVELHLNPKDLGPLSITLQLDHHNAQAQFFASHALVRDAVQQAIPQLREALASQGIALGQAMVGQQQQQNPGAFARPSHPSSLAGTTAVAEIAGPAQPAHVTRTTLRILPGHGVDLYA